MRDLHELAAMGNGLFLLVFLLGLWNGFAKGGSVFSMADVNLLFPSPDSPDAGIRFMPCFGR